MRAFEGIPGERLGEEEGEETRLVGCGWEGGRPPGRAGLGRQTDKRTRELQAAERRCEVGAGGSFLDRLGGMPAKCRDRLRCPV